MNKIKNEIDKLETKHNELEKIHKECILEMAGSYNGNNNITPNMINSIKNDMENIQEIISELAGFQA